MSDDLKKAKTSEERAAIAARQIMNQPGTVESEDLVDIAQDASKLKSPRRAFDRAKEVIAARKAPKANVSVKKDAFTLDDKGSNLMKETEPLKESFDAQNDDPADAPSRMKAVLHGEEHELPEEVPLPPRHKTPPGVTSEDLEECIKCGKKGHALDKCMMGKSLNDVKKSELSKAKTPAGQTKSGKDIHFGFMSHQHAGYTAEDHEDAAKLLHDKGHEMYSEGMNGDDGIGIASGRNMMGDAMKHSRKAKELKKSDTLNKSKTRIADIRAGMAHSQGVGPANGKAPNVHQDRMTGMKTAKPAPGTVAPKANTAGPAPKAAAAPSPHVAPAAPAAPGSKPKAPATASKPKYGKVIMKSGDSFNEVKKARVDEGKTDEGKAEARAQRNKRQLFSPHNENGNPIRSWKNKAERRDDVEAGAPGREGEEVEGSPKETETPGVHITSGAMAGKKLPISQQAPVTADSYGKVYRTGRNPSNSMGSKMSHNSLMAQSKKIKPNLPKDKK